VSGSGETISVQRTDGSSFPAYLSKPATPGAGVIVCHAYWGLTKHYEQLCDRLAQEGFAALAPSLYGGRSSDDPAVADELSETMDEDRAEADLTSALDRMIAEGDAESVAAIGFSLGGWAATRLAAARPEIVAVVPFYGYSRAADYGAMRAAAQGHFATVDEADDIDPRQFEKLLVDAGREVEVHVYEARHGFFNPDHPEDYDAPAAALAWDRMLSFLGAHLARGSRSTSDARAVPQKRFHVEGGTEAHP
jgi:carboxymethylenebutenolidase